MLRVGRCLDPLWDLLRLVLELPWEPLWNVAATGALVGPQLPTSRCSGLPTLSLSLSFELFLVIFCLFHMLVCSGGAVDRSFYLFRFHHLSCLVMMFSLFFIGLAGLVLGSVLRLLPDEALPHTDLPSRTPKAFQSPRQPGQPFNHGYFLS